MTLFKRTLPTPPMAAMFLAALLAVFGYMTLRNVGMYPTVFGDEWTYSSFARLMPFRETLIPNYLYYTVYGLTSACGDGYLECARLINAAFVVGAAPLIYLIARQYMTRQAAAVVAVLAALAPSNTYTAYFMPEAMYFWGFWLFSWSVLRGHGRAGVRAVAISSALLGLLALVKVHGLFLLPGYLVYLVYAAFARRGAAGGRHWLRQALLLVAVALLTAAAVRFTVGYLYAGRQGLYLLGTMYANQAQTRPGLGVLLRLALTNLEGHLMALALMFGMPLAAAAQHCISRAQRGVAARGSSTLLAYAALMIPSLVAVTALFTALVAGGGAESGVRLHMRYYDFTLPLLLILAGVQLAPSRAGPGWRARLLVAVPLLLVMGAACRYLIPFYTPNHIDSPSLFGMIHDPGSYQALIGFSLAAVLLWIARPRKAAQLFVYICTPVALVVSGANVNLYARMAQRPDAWVKAGLFAHHYLTPAEASRLTIVGDDILNLFKSRFFLDNTNVALLQLPHGQPITLASLPYPNGWLLVVGDYPLPEGAVRHSGLREYTLARVKPPADAKLHRFAETEDDSMRSTGLSGIEDWGRWSEGGQVTLTFDRPLPKKLLLRLDVAGYGPNAGQDIPVTAGGQTVALRADGKHGVQDLRFDTDGSVRVITIKVPQPTSPHDLGYGGDQRKLGVGLYSMEVIDAAAPRQPLPQP
ncbi:DUF7024 domain-containing protein [Duganella hordei]|uniref:DUF7024 domain-containing protein n=1 Tax=Duganella hordei TaxID=2865934 RepID=UPI0030E7B140